MYDLSPATPLKCVVITCLILALALTWTSGIAQQAVNPDDNQSAREWFDFKRARYIGRPILVHLRNGYERAVILPEPIKFKDSSQSLPGCAVAINEDVIGFFATRSFRRKAISFRGLNTGTLYELRVRASPEGIEQALQILR